MAKDIYRSNFTTFAVASFLAISVRTSSYLMTLNFTKTLEIVLCFGNLFEKVILQGVQRRPIRKWHTLCVF